MIKLAFALVALFYLCHSAPVMPAHHDPNLNNQMIERMNKLNKNVTFKPGFTLFYPGSQMRNNASACVITFIRELEKVLDNVTGPKGSKNHLEELRANLKALESAQENTNNRTNAPCEMKKKSNPSLPFTQYIVFVTKLNKSS